MISALGTVLLVEDEHALRRLVAAFLQGEGYAVVEAVDGPDGVAKFGDSGPFDLAILDLNLPGFSGVEVARQILSARADPRILICSAAIVRESEDALLEMGVGDFLTKPYHPEVLKAHVARMLQTTAAPRLTLLRGSAIPC